MKDVSYSVDLVHWNCCPDQTFLVRKKNRIEGDRLEVWHGIDLVLAVPSSWATFNLSKDAAKNLMYRISTQLLDDENTACGRFWSDASKY